MKKKMKVSLKDRLKADLRFNQLEIVKIHKAADENPSGFFASHRDVLVKKHNRTITGLMKRLKTL